jgi:hypothetical protein
MQAEPFARPLIFREIFNWVPLSKRIPYTMDFDEASDGSRWAVIGVRHPLT